MKGYTHTPLPRNLDPLNPDVVKLEFYPPLAPHIIQRKFLEMCVCVFIPSPVRLGTLLSEVPGTPIGASFFRI